MPPETNNEPDTEDDAAKEEEDSKERPKDHPGCYWQYQCTQLPCGSRSLHVTPGSQLAPHMASCASHLSILSWAIRLETARIVPGTDICIGCPAAGKLRRRQPRQLSIVILWLGVMAFTAAVTSFQWRWHAAAWCW
jgi:hypothetical protein